MKNDTSKPPKMGNASKILAGYCQLTPEDRAKVDGVIDGMLNGTSRYIIETPNQLWGAYSWDNTYPVTLQDGSSRHAKLHQFTDLAIAKQVLAFLSRERGGAKLKIWQLSDDGQRVEVAV